MRRLLTRSTLFAILFLTLDWYPYFHQWTYLHSRTEKSTSETQGWKKNSVCCSCDLRFNGKDQVRKGRSVREHVPLYQQAMIQTANKLVKIKTRLPARSFRVDRLLDRPRHIFYENYIQIIECRLLQMLSGFLRANLRRILFVFVIVL